MKQLNAILVLALLAPAVFAIELRPDGFVNDFAGILTDAEMLERELRLYEQNTTVEVAVVTIESLPPDYTLFSYGVELLEKWEIGKKGEDNGVLVLVVKNGTVGNRMRIEVGYGLQGHITGAEAGRMLDRALPFYEEENYQLAVESILIDISDELVDYQPTAVQRSSSYFYWELLLSNLPFVIFVSFALLSFALRNRCPYCIRGELVSSQGYYVCRRCRRRTTRRRRFAPVLIGGFGRGSSGWGGFGGGSSGGGGAGR